MFIFLDSFVHMELAKIIIVMCVNIYSWLVSFIRYSITKIQIFINQNLRGFDYING